MTRTLQEPIVPITYSSVPTVMWGQSHYVFACCCCDLATMQRSLRGDSKPGSPEFLKQVIGASDGPGGGMTPGHGFSSPRLAWQTLHDVGSCPADVGPQKRLIGWTKVTSAMRAAAAEYRVGEIAPLDYATLDYFEAIAYLADHPGAGVLLATYGYEGYVIVGTDGDGHGIWLDHNNRTGPPLVRRMASAEGDATWERMVTGGAKYGYGRDNYSLIVNPR